MRLIDITRDKENLVSILALWIVFSSFLSPALAQSNDSATVLENAKKSLSAHNSKSEISFLQYAEPKGVYVMQYPPDWTVEYKEGVTRFDPAKSTFKAPDLSLVSVTASESALWNEEQTKNQWAMYPTLLKLELELENTNVEILSSNWGKYQIAGHDAGFIVYRFTEASVIKVMGAQFTAVIGNEKIIFTFTTGESSFEKIFPNVELMVKSLQML